MGVSLPLDTFEGDSRREQFAGALARFAPRVRSASVRGTKVERIAAGIKSGELAESFINLLDGGSGPPPLFGLALLPT